ncbi:SDR family NAD(P)-dependent oxidoreductase [Pseudonocardia hydrocarbonoxydans]|nr:SDR family NAD(P)-dependent oxidoreductase [Pseudonocardia hydrocarbonoxydans]
MTSTRTRPLALVTGASSGIGLELAEQLVAHGYDLLVNAEDNRLHRAAAALDAGSDARITPVRADLRSATGVSDLYDAVRADGRPLQAAALNAGVGRGGAFLDIDIDHEIEIIEVNISSTVRLAKLVLTDMVARDEGRLLVTSSIASTMPGTYQAVYNASKSFLQSFTEAVAEELRDSAVTVTSLMPGPTETDFFHRADMDDTAVGASDKDDPAQVAAQGVRAMESGDGKVVAGSVSTKATGAANAVLPDTVKAVIHKFMARPGSAKS